MTSRLRRGVAVAVPATRTSVTFCAPKVWFDAQREYQVEHMRKLLVIVVLVAIVALLLIQFGPGVVFR